MESQIDNILEHLTQGNNGLALDQFKEVVNAEPYAINNKALYYSLLHRMIIGNHRIVIEWFDQCNVTWWDNKPKKLRIALRPVYEALVLIFEADIYHLNTIACELRKPVKELVNIISPEFYKIHFNGK